MLIFNLEQPRHPLNALHHVTVLTLLFAEAAPCSVEVWSLYI